MSNSIKVDSLILWGSDIPQDSLTNQNKSRWSSINIKIVIGKKDEYISDENKKKVIDAVNAYGLSYKLIEYDGPHKIIESELIKLDD